MKKKKHPDVGVFSSIFKNRMRSYLQAARMIPERTSATRVYPVLMKKSFFEDFCQIRQPADIAATNPTQTQKARTAPCVHVFDPTMKITRARINVVTRTVAN